MKDGRRKEMKSAGALPPRGSRESDSRRMSEGANNLPTGESPWLGLASDRGSQSLALGERRLGWNRRVVPFLILGFDSPAAAIVRKGKTDLEVCMEARIEKGKLIVEIDLNKEPELSKSGKTLVVASSRGNRATGATVKGKPVIVGLNAYIQ